MNITLTQQHGLMPERLPFTTAWSVLNERQQILWEGRGSTRRTGIPVLASPFRYALPAEDVAAYRGGGRPNV